MGAVRLSTSRFPETVRSTTRPNGCGLALARREGLCMFTLILMYWPYELAALALILASSGFVVIGEHQVGIVIKKFSGASLADGRFIALNGEAGIQADTLAPGYYFTL